ncbi:MAG: hypothetical protein CVU43_22655 [Chloroflexi bacterium HGW-Chloroflexi-5]|jgi:hypothetical protein|nr:MAG: hypothetical protein CVU43_22655 [Chloroflexi bacterium HGW-Chloroflexi-5]
MKSRFGSFVSGLATLLSASCCVLPVVLLAVGLSNLGALSVLMRYRAITLPFSFLMLASAFYLVYRPQAKEDCAKGICSPQALKRHRLVVWISAGLMLAFIVFSFLPISLTM